MQAEYGRRRARPRAGDCGFWERRMWPG